MKTYYNIPKEASIEYMAMQIVKQETNTDLKNQIQEVQDNYNCGFFTESEKDNQIIALATTFYGGLGFSCKTNRFPLSYNEAYHRALEFGEMDENDEYYDSLVKFIGGKVIHTEVILVNNSRQRYDLYVVVIEDPQYEATALEICGIFDRGNHCLSNASIFYEDDYCNITWSNLGHL